jgi:hypothetical protein
MSLEKVIFLLFALLLSMAVIKSFILSLKIVFRHEFHYLPGFKQELFIFRKLLGEHHSNYKKRENIYGKHVKLYAILFLIYCPIAVVFLVYAIIYMF